MKRKKLLIRLALMLAIVVAIDQGLQYTVLADGYFLSRRIMPYDPPLFFGEQEVWYERLASHLETGEPAAQFFKLDADLGWCPPPDSGRGNMNYDWSGSRLGFAPLPSTKTAGVTRVLAIGCSFTRGDEVGDTETWAAYLDRDRDDLELANLGVGAFGIDQALMRLRRDGDRVEPDEVWLGILPAAALRTLTLYRPALRHWTKSPAFKPRFELDERGELELIPNPAPDLETAAALLSDQAKFFEAIAPHDSIIQPFLPCWLPKGSHAIHYSGLARLALTFREARKPSPRLPLARADSELRLLMRALCLQARAECNEQNRRFRILILPGRDDLQSFASPEGPYWQGLVDDLRSDGVEVLDLSETLLATGAIERDELWQAGQHYSPEANRIVADGLLRLIER